MSSPVVRTLYAALLRLAISFDSKRASKALIYRISSERSYKSPSTLYYSSIVDQLLGTTTFFPASRIDLSFKTIVRNEFRKNAPNNIELSDRITTGFAFLRKFSLLWSQYEASTGRPRRRIPKDEKFNIQFVNELKTGVMLCAHPLIPGYMQRALILILEHNPEKGSYGLIINKKTDHNVETSTLNMPPELLQVFQKNIVYFGGNIPRVQILHPFPDCGGKEIPGSSSPLYDFSNGSIKKAIDIASKSSEIAEKFQFFVGCCVWKPGMLEQEVKEGTWMTLSGEVDQILQHVAKEPLSESYAVLKRSKQASGRGIGEEELSLLLAAEGEGDEEKRKAVDAVAALEPAGGQQHHQKDIYEGANETWSRVLWSLCRQTNHFAHLDANLDSSVVDSIDWHYSDELEDDEDDDESD
jgi:putative transcriptional regulator